MNYNDTYFLNIAINIAKQNVKNKIGGPFGAIVVLNNEIISEGYNQVTKNNDPTAHAEIDAIRKACLKLNTFQLKDCTIYSSCEPCPMCLGAIYWARPTRLVFAASKNDAANFKFDDSYIYNEINLDFDSRKLTTLHIDLPHRLDPFKLWEKEIIKTSY